MTEAKKASGKFSDVIIASDMDGTFLGPRASLVERNLRAIEYFISEGGHFTFATGRNHIQLLHSMPKAPEIVNMPVVACNGASLYDLSAMREEKGYLIDYSVVRELSEFLASESDTVGIRCGTDRKFLYDRLTNYFIKMDHDYNPGSEVAPVSAWASYPIYKLAVRDTEEILCRLRPMMEERFAGRLEITQSATTLIDIQTAGRTKAVLLSELVASFGRPMTLCVAGDYDNDLEMLSIADLPVCPENAVPAVKAICKHCFCHHKDGVIADLIEFLDKDARGCEDACHFSFKKEK